jgi:hypothetical protein
MKKVHLILIIIIVINLLLRLPGLFDPVSYGDECIYLTLGQAFNKGLVYYRDIHDNKPPLLYLTAALAGGYQTYFRLITYFVNSLNVFLIYLLAKKLLTKPVAGLVAAALFAFFSLLPEGRIANAELFMIMPVTLAVFISFKAYKKEENKLWFLAGILFSLAFLFKVPIGFDFAGFMIAFFLFPLLNQFLKTKKVSFLLNIFKNKGFYLAVFGFLAPIILSVVYYSFKGAFTPYVRSALLQNIGYLASWGGSNTGLYIRAGMLLFITLIIFVIRKKVGFGFTVVSLLGFWGLYGVFLSERPYPHYYLEITPWATMMIVILIFQKQLKQLVLVVLFVALLSYGHVVYDFWWYKNVPYYQNFFKFVAGQYNREEYFKTFGSKVLDDYNLAYLIKTLTDKDDRVFIWGDGACIYALSRRLPPGRYTVNYHIFDFKGYQETLDAIKQTRPELILKLKSETEEFLQLDSYIDSLYFSLGSQYNADIYKKI